MTQANTACKQLEIICPSSARPTYNSRDKVSIDGKVGENYQTEKTWRDNRERSGKPLQDVVCVLHYQRHQEAPHCLQQHHGDYQAIVSIEQTIVSNRWLVFLNRSKLCQQYHDYIILRSTWSRWRLIVCYGGVAVTLTYPREINPSRCEYHRSATQLNVPNPKRSVWPLQDLLEVDTCFINDENSIMICHWEDGEVRIGR
jgi:hypothetical protein